MIVKLCSEDLANQIRLSEEYREAIKKRDWMPGRFLAPPAGEFLSGSAVFLFPCDSACSPSMLPGLPLGWTSPVVGSVNKKLVDQMWPEADSVSFNRELQHHSGSVWPVFHGWHPIYIPFRGNRGAGLGLTQAGSSCL